MRVPIKKSGGEGNGEDGADEADKKIYKQQTKGKKDNE